MTESEYTYKTPAGTELEWNDEDDRLEPVRSEQLPLDVCSSSDGCFIFDQYGAEVGFTSKGDWEYDPKGMIVGMAKELKTAYENPIERLNYAAGREPMFLFYDPEYPTDDVTCKETLAQAVGEFRELPPLEGRDEPDPVDSELSVQLVDHYAEEPPSEVRIVEGEDVLKEWIVEENENEQANVELGAEVAWNIRLAYERPWEIRC